MENQQPKPNDYLVWSILTTLFCCLPIGIAASTTQATTKGPVKRRPQPRPWSSSLPPSA